MSCHLYTTGNEPAAGITISGYTVGDCLQPAIMSWRNAAPVEQNRDVFGCDCISTFTYQIQGSGDSHTVTLPQVENAGVGTVRLSEECLPPKNVEKVMLQFGTP